MKSGREKIMLIEPEEISRLRLSKLLEEAGYDIAAPSDQPGLQQVLSFGPDLLILDAEPPHLDCCSLLTELKVSSANQTRVIMLASGGPAERTRGLDLGADDVISRPWHSGELLARVRVQLRLKHSQDEARERARIAEEGQHTERTVFRALAVTRRMDRFAFSFRRSVKIGAIIVGIVAAVLSAILFTLYHRTQSETKRTYAAIAQLERSVAAEQDLVGRARRMREAEQSAANSSEPQKQKLTQQSEELSARLATAQAEQVAALRRELDATNVHLRRLEDEEQVAQTIIRSYAGSVCLLHVVVSFQDKATGRPLRYAGVNAQGQPQQNENGSSNITIEGDGPEVRLDVFGTGFLAAQGGRILTNRHVVEPAWNNDELESLVRQGVEPVVTEMSAYFPSVSHPLTLRLLRISQEADLALLQADVGKLGLKQVALDSRSGAAVSGQAVVLLGYATGLDAILARAGDDAIKAIATSSDGKPAQIMSELARRNLIRPINTQGHIGDLLPDKIVYDAQTTSGGSGGPLFNAEGKVIGVNYAAVRGFGGSNFAIPIRYAESLLSH